MYDVANMACTAGIIWALTHGSARLHRQAKASLVIHATWLVNFSLFCQALCSLRFWTSGTVNFLYLVCKRHAFWLSFLFPSTDATVEGHKRSAARVYGFQRRTSLAGVAPFHRSWAPGVEIFIVTSVDFVEMHCGERTV